MARELEPINPNPPRPSTTTPSSYTGSGSIRGATFQTNTGLFDPDTVRGNSVTISPGGDLQSNQRGGLSDAHWNLAEFLENFLATFGFDPFIGTGINPSELDIPNLSPADVDDIWESIDPGLKDFMSLFLEGIEGLDADDIDRINRQEQANEWLDAYTKYLKDEITLEDLQAVDVSDLTDMDGWDDYYSGIVGDTTGSGGDAGEGLGELDATTSNADIRQILRDNGYSEEAIEEIFDSAVNNDRFKGNNVLSNALCQIGYSNCSDWSVTAVNPTGDECANDDGYGTYQNGECVTDTSEGTPCWTYSSEAGGRVEGKRGPNGECIPFGSGGDDGTDGGGNEGNEGGGTGVGDECEIQLPFGAGTIKGEYDEEGNCIPLGVNGGDGTGDPCDDPENASLPECVEKSFEDYVKEVGEGVANTAKGLYDELGDKITECVGSPIDCIKQIGTAILDAGGIPPECQDMGDPWFCTEKGPDEGGKACWKDCVSFNLPGLPIPNIPLPPGVIDVGTYRDFEDAVKTVGKTIGDVIEGNESCGPDGDQECTVGQILEDVGTWAKETWEGIFSGVDDATVDDVLDWLKGILGPVTAGIIWAQIEEEVTNVLGPIPLTDDNFDCATVGREGGVVQTEDQCDACLEGYEDIEGQCQEKDDPITNQGPTAAECASEHREFIEATDIEDSECGECLAGWIDEDGVCVEDSGTTPPEECESGEVRRGGLDDGECVRIDTSCFSEPGKYDGDDPTISQGQINSEGFCVRPGDGELTDDERCNGPRPPQTQNDKNYCFQQGYAPCPEGTEEYQDGRWYKEGTCTALPPPEQGTPCDSNGDGTLDGKTDANGNCLPTPVDPPTTTCQDPNATNQGSDGPCECPEGYQVSSDGTQCVLEGTPPTPPDECSPRGTVLESGCDGTTFFIRFASGEVDPNTGECGEIYDSVPNYSGCAGNGGICEDPNAVNNGEEGDCRCKPGFVKGDDGLCFQSGDVCDNGATLESGCDICPDGTPTIEYEDGKCPTSTPPQDCSNPAYAAANPQQCGGVPPVTPPSSGGGGGAGGGGVGAFSPFIAGIEYTPQPLPAAPAAPQKDYMAELDGLIKRRLFEGIS